MAHFRASLNHFDAKDYVCTLIVDDVRSQEDFSPRNGKIL